MKNREYISYLNSLHNYNAQNPNAYGEKNVGNQFFEETAVKVGLSSYIQNQFLNEEPHILILTGHAGDGKTSLMYQVLKEFNITLDIEEKISDVEFPNGSKCRCIKDYSELNDSEKLEVLKECITYPENGKYVFMVSNTGPLINTFGELFDEDERENAKINLIDAMDDNSVGIKDISGYKISIINVASVDNTNFAVEFVKNLVKESLWEKCNDCSKKGFCHIVNNRDLIVENQQQVLTFLQSHYIWLVEHGIRLTIRSMTEQIAYMLTGGINCDQVVPMERDQLIFFNLFFGYIGLKNNEKANMILAVREAKKLGYDQKRLRADEKLLIECDYSVSFGDSMNRLLMESHKNNGYISGWAQFLRRAYLFTNIESDTVTRSRDYEDIFSKQFERYLQLRNGKSTPSRTDTNLITDALSMMYLGHIADNSVKNIPITLSKTSGLTQNVQLVTGNIPIRSMKLVQVEARDSIFDDNNKRYKLKLKIEKNTLDCIIDLPMFDYFEELRNGVISTNIDPQLSHGIESLKAQLANEYNDTDEEQIELIILRNDKSVPYCLEIEDDCNIRSV